MDASSDILEFIENVKRGDGRIAGHESESRIWDSATLVAAMRLLLVVKTQVHSPPMGQISAITQCGCYYTSATVSIYSARPKEVYQNSRITRIASSGS